MSQSRLIIRLSSLGDLILSTTALDPNSLKDTDWLTLLEYRDLLKDHPSIRRLFTYERKLGLRGWLKLGRLLRDQGYDEVIDLQRNSKTLLLKYAFLFWGANTRWKRVSKERIRLYGTLIFKKFWPWPPTPWVRRYATLGQNPTAQPQISHLLSGSAGMELELILKEAQGRDILCVMPSSKWNRKTWKKEHYEHLFRLLPDRLFPVVLGGLKDQASRELVDGLVGKGIPHYSAVGRLDLKNTAKLFQVAKSYVGVDTGLSHLAEAVGLPTTVIFGPTTPEMGFGPWREGNRSCGTSLWCRPCSKLGSHCFRPIRKQLCLIDLTPESVLKTIVERDVHA